MQKRDANDLLVIDQTSHSRKSFKKILFYFQLTPYKFSTLICSKVDIYLGTLAENHVAETKLIASYVFYQYSLTWCVQKRKEIPMHQLAFHICRDPMVFLAFTVTILVVVWGTYFTQMFERHSNWDYNAILFNGTCLLLGFSCPYNPENAANRIGYAFFLWGSIIFVTLITTTITVLFTLRIYRPQVETISEILDSHFDLIGSQFVLQQLLQQNEVN